MPEERQIVSTPYIESNLTEPLYTGFTYLIVYPCRHMKSGIVHLNHIIIY